MTPFRFIVWCLAAALGLGLAGTLLCFFSWFSMVGAGEIYDAFKKRFSSSHEPQEQEITSDQIVEESEPATDPSPGHPTRMG
jgi:hypothetical protein